MLNNQLTWIHVSDLHMEQQNRFDRGLVLEALWRDIARFLDQDIRPDFVFFTGDVAFRAISAEYELATSTFFEPILQTLGLTVDKLLIVPGNHDVSRSRTARIVNPLPDLRNQDCIRSLLEDFDHRELLLSRFAPFQSFASSYLELGSESSRSLWFSRSVQVGSSTVAILGLNSAWLSGFNKSSSTEVEDYGHLALGELQLESAIQHAGEANLHIVLMHHPIDWLMEADRRIIEPRLARLGCILLRGHLHQANLIHEANLAGNILSIPAGAVFQGKGRPNAYNIVRLNVETGEGTVYFRCYSEKRGEWQKDLESTGEKANGECQFRLSAWYDRRRVLVGFDSERKDVREYECKISSSCRRDMTRLNMNKKTMLDLVHKEFEGHLNYFRTDLVEYPLPLGSKYIVHINKVGNLLEFKRIFTCDKNEAMLVSWSRVLEVYRQASTMSYRENPDLLIFKHGMLGRVLEVQHDLQQSIVKHYAVYVGVTLELDFGTRRRLDGKRARSSRLQRRFEEQVRFHLVESEESLAEARRFSLRIDNGDVDQSRGLGMMVAQLERSLQHLHKIITLGASRPEVSK